MQNSGCRLFACNPDRLWLHPCFSDSFSLRKVRLKANPDAPYQQCLILDLAKGSTTKKKRMEKIKKNTHTHTLKHPSNFDERQREKKKKQIEESCLGEGLRRSCVDIAKID